MSTRNRTLSWFPVSAGMMDVESASHAASVMPAKVGIHATLKRGMTRGSGA